MSDALVARRTTFLGLFLVTLATLAYEVLLTRIFSVTMWYHFAFMAISIAMFGMTLGALRVYLQPSRFPPEQTQRSMAWSALLTGLLMIVGVGVHIAAGPLLNGSWEVLGLALTFLAISLPFFESGICVCLALTRFPKQSSRLYAADLAGAATGCLLVIALLHELDAVAAVAAVAVLSCAAAWLFADPATGSMRARAGAVGLLLVGLIAGHLSLGERSPLRITWTKGGRQSRVYYEKWNSFSRLAVMDGPQTPFGWSLSKTFDPVGKIPHHWLIIDSAAGTLLTHYDGDLSKVEYLKYDVSNIAQYLRPQSKVMVIGSGGGTDILSALVFGQKEITGVEMNEDVLRILNDRYGEFTGHLDRDPRVHFVNQEGRSYAASGGDPVDILQLTFIDTWAATAAGAFVLSENSLYTRDAWKLFLERLTPTGILTVCRGYVSDPPYEIFRLTSLAREALRLLGVDKPEQHIAVVANRTPGPQSWGQMATVLVSRAPFSKEDLDTLEQTSQRLDFDILVSPRRSSDPDFQRLVAGADVSDLEDRLHMTLDAPTDDKPFFFQMLRPSDFLHVNIFSEDADPNQSAVAVLFRLLAVIALLTGLCIGVPLARSARGTAVRAALPWLAYFGCIGLGFMFVEISQMQRLILFLGHPVYGLSVILFALLLSGGLGSYLTSRIGDGELWSSGRRCLGGLLLAMGVFGALGVPALASLQHQGLGVRLVAAVAILFPLGAFMGTAFPLGMRLAQLRVPELPPWLWGINGATSVLASVLAVAVALLFGIGVSYWTGVASYALATLALATAERLRPA